MTTMILRLVRGWYDPAAQTAREERTQRAVNRTVAVQATAKSTEQRVGVVRHSYELAGRRVSGRTR